MTRAQGAVLPRTELKRLVMRELKKQGFASRNGQFVAPANETKEQVRSRHQLAVQHKLDAAQRTLARFESCLLQRIANGQDLCPQRTRPTLVEVLPGTEDELLFRYASLHWSIPISSGYGRRLRFLVIDSHNDKLIGIIGLGDPVFGLRARDEWIGWNFQQRRDNLRYVMDAFVLGAVPPYSMLLFGKLVALICASDEVRLAFQKKYQKQRALISGKPFDGRLALITTTSALGRSSIYNRLKFKDDLVFQSAGFTGAWGEIYFSNGLYAPLQAYAEANLDPTAKQSAWGNGFRNRREVVRKCLQDIGLHQEALRHRIEREVFVVPLARNTRNFLRGEHVRLQTFHRPTTDLSDWFVERWLLPRLRWDDQFRAFNRESYRLWPTH